MNPAVFWVKGPEFPHFEKSLKKIYFFFFFLGLHFPLAGERPIRMTLEV